MNKNTILITVICLLAIFGFLWGVYAMTSSPEKISFPEVNSIKNDDHVKWSKEKKNILVEYADLQCEACRAFHGFFKKWEKEDPKTFAQVKQKVTFVQRHFPLSAHKNSQQASYAAEAAGKQGKFFEYVDVLFREQPTWDKITSAQELEKLFLSYALESKLDTTQFQFDMKSSEVRDKVASDMAQGNAVGVNSTPTFFLNAEKQTDVRSFDEFKTKLSQLK